MPIIVMAKNKKKKEELLQFIQQRIHRNYNSAECVAVSTKISQFICGNIQRN